MKIKLLILSLLLCSQYSHAIYDENEFNIGDCTIKGDLGACMAMAPRFRYEKMNDKAFIVTKKMCEIDSQYCWNAKDLAELLCGQGDKAMCDAAQKIKVDP
jgi:hypothetical protein